MPQKTVKEVEQLLKAGYLKIVVPPSKLKAEIWKEFGFVQPTAGPETSSTDPGPLAGFAACRKCKRVYAYDSKATGTKTLINHSKSCSVAGTTAAGQLTLEKALGLGVPRSAKRAVIEAAVEFVCLDMRPFTAIGGKGMSSLASSLVQAGAKYGCVAVGDLLPAPNTIKNCVIGKAERCKATLSKILGSCADRKMVAFTTDLWSDDYRKVSYMDLSAFYVDSSFALHQHTLSCAAFPEERKTAENIKAALIQKLRDYNLIKPDGATDIVSFWFTTDCGANIVAALKNGKAVQCAAHRLNTIFRTAWHDTEAVNDDASQFKAACHKLVMFAKHGNLQQKLNSSLKAESATRWNSFYFTLKSINKNYDKLNENLQGTHEFRLLASIDYPLLINLTGFLKIFKQITDVLEGERQPTLQNVVLAYHSIMDHCHPQEDDANILAVLKACILTQLVQKMKLNPIHWAATFFDPSARKLLMLRAEDRPAKLAEIAAYIGQHLCASVTSEVRHEDAGTTNPGPSAKRPKTGLFQKYRSGSPTTLETPNLTLDQELQAYCEMETKGDSSNPLEFWSHHRIQFPRLSNAAAQVLVVPATSASSERTFSAAGRIYEQRRTRLNPSTVDAILCVRSFLMDPVTCDYC